MTEAACLIPPPPPPRSGGTAEVRSMAPTREPAMHTEIAMCADPWTGLKKERGGTRGSVNSQQVKSALSMPLRHKAAIALAGWRKVCSVWVVLF